MAWRPHRYLIGGELDNTQPEHVTGWMYFVGMPQRVEFDLRGDFHRDIRGSAIEFRGYVIPPVDYREAAEYFKHFSVRQSGVVGNMTAGLPPFDYGRAPYIEWYSNENGRVVLELEPNQVRVRGAPIPYPKSKPPSKGIQAKALEKYLRQLYEELSRAKKKRGGDGNGSANTNGKKA